MCFSAGASFISGAIISSVGVACIAKVKKPTQVVFAIIPLLFGVQQITEGVVWLALPSPDLEILQKFATYAFLLFAQIIWPTIIPLSVLNMEENQKRKKPLKILLFTGMAVSLYFTFCLLFFNVYPQIKSYHIIYATDFPQALKPVVFSFYLIATITPFFISSNRRMYYFGSLMFLSCAVTAIVYFEHLTSVWCFFAALLSVTILFILRSTNKKLKLE